MRTEIFCFANGDVKVFSCIPILFEIIVVCLPGKANSIWYLIKTQDVAAQNTQRSPEELPGPGRKPWAATSHRVCDGNQADPGYRFLCERLIDSSRAQDLV